MLTPDESRARIHELIDQIPDEQIGMLWMTFQSMLGVSDEDEDDNYGEDMDEVDELDEI